MKHLNKFNESFSLLKKLTRSEYRSLVKSKGIDITDKSKSIISNNLKEVLSRELSLYKNGDDNLTVHYIYPLDYYGDGLTININQIEDEYYLVIMCIKNIVYFLVDGEDGLEEICKKYVSCIKKHEQLNTNIPNNI